MIVLNRDDGSSDLWDGIDLRKRIEFAIDRSRTLNSTQRKSRPSSAGPSSREMKEKDLRKTIILNAKVLIERDADFAKFAGRILLTYIYEEVLGWRIVEDGIEKLRRPARQSLPAVP